MAANTWTIVATQLVTTLGIVYFLIQRIDNLSRRMDEQGRELRQDLGGRIDGVRDDLGARIDRLTARFDSHLERHHTI